MGKPMDNFSQGQMKVRNSLYEYHQTRGNAQTIFNEDLGDGDLSSEFIFSADQLGSFSFTRKKAEFLRALIIEHGFLLLDRSIEVNLHKKMERWLSQVMCLL